MAGDFWALYGLTEDCLAVSPCFTRIMSQLLQRVGYEPYSMFRAMQLGSPSWFGWTLEAEAVASVVEETRGNTLTVAAVAGGKRRKVERYEGRPHTVKQRPRTIKDALRGLPVVTQ